MATREPREIAGLLIAFDVFGTLADTGSVEGELTAMCGTAATKVASTWRARQLEYMFRVTAMGLFPPFGELTHWALAAALADGGVAVQPGRDIERLAHAYRRLKPFPDVVPAVRELHHAQHQLVAFSVGPRAWLEELTDSYAEFVDQVVSAEDAGVYKPHPGIYKELLHATKRPWSEVLLVSSNPFDLIAAGAVRIHTAGCRRDPTARFDPWGPPPDHVISTLSDLRHIAAAPEPSQAPSIRSVTERGAIG